jgi:AraC-like DNA-binding protein
MDEYKKQFVLNMLAYAVQREVPPDQLCALSRIDLAGLRTPGGNISTKQMSDLWLNAAKLTNDPLFGLHFGESLQLAALGVVGQIIQASKTVGEALTYAAGSIQLISDAASMTVSRKDHRIVISFIPTPAGEAEPGTLLQWMDFFMVFAIHEMDGLVLKKIKPLKVILTGRDVRVEEYERVLRCTPGTHSATSCILEFDDRYWDEPIITANYELQQHLLSILNSTKQTAAEPLVSERIIDYLTANAYLGIASLDEIASNFNTSARSLQRKLRDEGVSFQQLADSVRKSIALHYLRSGDHPLKEISYLLGYNETSAFTRAFRRWTGKTPADFKKST